ncbi:MAG: F0F1 ATP synthase subunit A [Candidatus Tectomicrobia bacterium]|uniref:ATP synthase subunit a n=1 Tax=Tectimicrobiota bacterium TaxID=2528274 RepID=A0A932I084_UNCTE|nr:F0F1 ATP synthase subunit A [Candidatus Tectomicrobia bacterium]
MEKFHPFLYLSFIPAFEEYPGVLYTWVVMAFLIAVAVAATRALQTIPYGTQNVLETLFEGVNGFMQGALGPQGKPYFPLIFTLAVYLYLNNVIGILPGAMAPTSNVNTNIGCALTVFFATHYIGFKKSGLGYFKHFTGPIIWLAPLMVPIELISHLARPLSLTLRLFGNITGEELVLGVLMLLCLQIFLPLPWAMQLFAMFGSFIQAFVFVLLSMIYIAGSLEGHEHDEHGHEGAHAH